MVLKELYDTEAIYQTKEKEYRVQLELYKQYIEYFENMKDDQKTVPMIRINKEIQKELIHWIGNWIELKNQILV